MNDDHTYDGSNYADAECYMEDAHSLDFDGDRPRALIAMAFAQVKATLAIADALADLKPEPVTVTHPWSNPLTMTHPWPPWPSTLPDVDAADRYAANEERQRKEAEPDPLDEDDHRDRLGGGGSRWTHRAHLWCLESCACYEGSWKLDQIDDLFGPLAFAPDADGTPSAIRLAVNAKRALMTAQLRQVISSVQDSGDLAELDALADEWEAGTDG